MRDCLSEGMRVVGRVSSALEVEVVESEGVLWPKRRSKVEKRMSIAGAPWHHLSRTYTKRCYINKLEGE